MSANRWERSGRRFNLLSPWQRLHRDPYHRAIDIDLIHYGYKSGAPSAVFECGSSLGKSTRLTEQWALLLSATPYLFVSSQPPTELYNVTCNVEELNDWALKQTALLKNLNTGKTDHINFEQYQELFPARL